MITPDDLSGFGLPFERQTATSLTTRDKRSYSHNYDGEIDLGRSKEMMAYLRSKNLQAYKVVGLHEYLGFSYDFIGEILGADRGKPLSRQAAHQLYQLGIDLLREKFGPRHLAAKGKARRVAQTISARLRSAA